MRRKIVFFLIMIIIIVSIIAVSGLNFKTKEIVSLNNNQKTNNLSIMLQDEKGMYQEGNSSFNQEGYHFNSKRSKCLMGSKIKYDEIDKSLSINTTKSDRCYAYFDNNNFVEDLSGNGNHGINNGAIWQKDGLLLGDENQFYGYVNCGLKNYNFKNSVSFVLKYSSKVLGGHLISNHEGAGLALMAPSTGSVIFNLYISELADYKYAESSSSLNKIGVSSILIGTYDGKEIKVYLDGIEVASLEAEGNIKPSSAPIVIGGNPLINGTLSSGYGYILVQEALIFDRALTEEEIAQDYASNINPINKEDLLLWYKF